MAAEDGRPHWPEENCADVCVANGRALKMSAIIFVSPHPRFLHCGRVAQLAEQLTLNQ